jgi:hypothetical protein
MSHLAARPRKPENSVVGRPVKQFNGISHPKCPGKPSGTFSLHHVKSQISSSVYSAKSIKDKKLPESSGTVNFLWERISRCPIISRQLVDCSSFSLN